MPWFCPRISPDGRFLLKFFVPRTYFVPIEGDKGKARGYWLGAIGWFHRRVARRNKEQRGGSRGNSKLNLKTKIVTTDDAADKKCFSVWVAETIFHATIYLATHPRHL
jgi:hypothetical protein